jgi:hypothetical protein
VAVFPYLTDPIFTTVLKTVHPGSLYSDRSLLQAVGKAGPVPPGAARSAGRARGETFDAISGHFRIFQLEAGHRFSTDDVLTAWYGTSWAPSASRVLDLGRGSARWA